MVEFGIYYFMTFHCDLTTWFHVASLPMTLKPTSGVDALAAAEAGIRFAVVFVEYREFLKVALFGQMEVTHYHQCRTHSADLGKQ